MNSKALIFLVGVLLLTIYNVKAERFVFRGVYPIPPKCDVSGPCKSVFLTAPVLVSKRKDYLIGFNQDKKSSIKAASRVSNAYCKSLGYKASGSIIGAYLQPSDLASNPTGLTTIEFITFKKQTTCSGAYCLFIAGVECVPKGEKRCPVDKGGNIGNNNAGSSNFGHSNNGSANIGSCNNGSANIGNNNRGSGNVGSGFSASGAILIRRKD